MNTFNYIHAVILLALSGPAMACKMEFRTEEEMQRAASIMFKGKVESVKTEITSNGFGYMYATFIVQNAVKGVKRGEHRMIQTTRSTCGFSFAKDQVWMILADGNPTQSNAASGSYLIENENGTVIDHNKKRADETIQTLTQK